MKSKKLENTNSKFNKEVLNYLSDNLSQGDRYAFEKQLHEDDFDFEAMEGLEDFDANDISDAKNELNNLLAQKTSKKKYIIYYRLAAAAAVGLLLVFSVNKFLIQNINNKNQLISEEVQVNKQAPATELDAPPAMPDDKVQEIIESKVEKPVVKEEKADKQVHKQENIEFDIQDKEEELASIAESDEMNEDSENAIQEKHVSALPVRVETETIAKAEESSLVPKTTKKDIQEVPIASFVASENSGGDSDIIIIRGKVVDINTEKPLPGVNLVMEEAKLGTMTDINGDFQISVPSKFADNALKVNYIGFVTEQIPVKKDTSILVALSEDVLAMDEVVVVGYGSDKKSKKETGSISVVEMPDGKTPVEEDAQPVIGFSEYRKYLNDNIKVPDSLTEGKTEKVKVKVTIHKDNQIRRVDILSSPGDEFSDEAIRLLLEGPEWQAKTVNGEPETSEVVLRIKFRK